MQQAHNHMPKRPPGSGIRTTTMFEPRSAEAHNRHRPVPEWTIPPSRSGRTPRAATLFLGRDLERWKSHVRDSLDGDLPSTAGPVHLAWKRGTASLMAAAASSSTLMSESDEGETDEETVLSEDGDGTASASGSSAAPTRRGSRSRRSSSRASRSRSASWCARILGPQAFAAAGGAMGSTASTASTTPERELLGSSGTAPRPRRFSSNGPEAAFLRHETVIGIHTPRRESDGSGPPSGASSGRHTPSGTFERIALAPLSQIKKPLHGSGDEAPAMIESAAEQQLRTHSKKKRPSHRRIQSGDILAAAAAAAVAAAQHPEAVPEVEKQASPTMDASEQQAEEMTRATSYSSLASLAPPAPRPEPPYRTTLPLARRRRPIRVEGTLYDRSGPFREGAVTDGLSVRLFSSADSSPSVGFAEAVPLEGASTEDSSAVCDDDAEPTTYLITTPDNRVSSAAKLRRWAMDGTGHFWAAMELMSIERKMRHADASAGGISKAVMRGLRERYVEDLLDEVQKAETLNPGRDGVVAKVLRTSDNKYIRLEEDYPEEAFFVIAGCDETELYPVVALVFCGALRAISRFHAAGWMHGDVKLENLMFDERAQLVVIDYENANPWRGSPDGRVALVSYDWIPPEAFPGPHGRRAGPSADLWALGANMVRAFALRDGVDDLDVREALLGKGQASFLAFRRQRLIRRASAENGASGRRTQPTAADIDLEPILKQDDAATSSPAPGPSPSRLLSAFARAAPALLRFVLARCLSELPEERGPEAEREGLQIVAELEAEREALRDDSTLAVGERAVRTALDLSGSAWVKPKLTTAYESLGLA